MLKLQRLFLMTHNEKRFSAVREAQIALVTGAFYGSVHTLTGHPLDTIKSKMQLQVNVSFIINLFLFIYLISSCFENRASFRSWVQVMLQDRS